MLNDLLFDLDGRKFSQTIGDKHFQIKHSFKLPKMYVNSIDEMMVLAADYVKHHATMSEPGKTISNEEAQAISSDLLKQKKGSIWKAYSQARTSHDIVDVLHSALLDNEWNKYVDGVFKKYENDKLQLLREYATVGTAKPRRTDAELEKFLPYWKDMMLEFVDYMKPILRILCDYNSPRVTK